MSRAADTLPTVGPSKVGLWTRLAVDCAVVIAFIIVTIAALSTGADWITVVIGFSGIFIGAINAWRTIAFYRLEQRLRLRIQYHANRANLAEAEIARLKRLLSNQAKF